MFILVRASCNPNVSVQTDTHTCVCACVCIIPQTGTCFVGSAALKQETRNVNRKDWLVFPFI